MSPPSPISFTGTVPARVTTRVVGLTREMMPERSVVQMAPSGPHASSQMVSKPLATTVTARADPMGGVTSLGVSQHVALLPHDRVMLANPSRQAERSTV